VRIAYLSDVLGS